VGIRNRTLDDAHRVRFVPAQTEYGGVRIIAHPAVDTEDMNQPLATLAGSLSFDGAKSVEVVVGALS